MTNLLRLYCQPQATINKLAGNSPVAIFTQGVADQRKQRHVASETVAISL